MADEEKRSEEEAAVEADSVQAASSVDELADTGAQNTVEAPEGHSEAAANDESPSDDDHDDHGHGPSGDGGHGHDDHLGHTAPMSLLIGVLVALGLLTVLTVAVTAVDLGGQGNFVVAMVIATVKAVLVMGYFMHMFWDAKFNVVAFTSSFLFLLLFLAMALLDRSEYQDDVDRFEVDQKVQAAQ